METSGTTCGPPCEKLTPIGKKFHLLYLSGKGERGQQWIDSGATTQNRKSAASAARRMLRNVAFCNAVNFHRDQIAEEIHFDRSDLLKVYVEVAEREAVIETELGPRIDTGIDGNRVRAADSIAKMQGWNAPTSVLLLRGIQEGVQADNAVLLEVAADLGDDDGRVDLREVVEEAAKRTAAGRGGRR